MKWCCCLFSSVLFISSFAASQEVSKDSVKTYQLKEIVVTATRSNVSSVDLPSQVDVIDREDVESANATTVADLLQSSTSAFLKSQGSLAALKTLSLRGGASEEVLVLINGFRYSTLQNNLADVSLLPLNDIERVEIVHGGNSAYYGADALSGVVNIITRQRESSFGVRTEGSLASFDHQRYLLESQFGNDNGGILVGLANERGRDNYSFTYVDPANLPASFERTGNDVVQQHEYFHGMAKPDDRSSLAVDAQHVQEDRGTPGPFDPLNPSMARQSDNNVNLSISYNDRHADGIELFIRSGYQNSLENYMDPNPLYPYVTFYKNIYANINPEAHFVCSSAQKLIVGVDLGQGTLESPDFDSKITRVQKTIYLSSETHFNTGSTLFGRFSFYETVRYDNVSDVDVAITPKFGINMRVSQAGDFRLRASIGENFRSPTFNDLYYRGFSNPNLLPERGTSIDAGLSSTFSAAGDHSIEVTYFHLHTQNKIVFDFTTFLPQNIGTSTSGGLEVKYSGHVLSDHVVVGGNYSLTNAIKENKDNNADPTFGKQITYIPQHVVNLSGSLHLDPVTFNIMHTIVGRRYTSADNTKSLDPYRLINVNLVVKEPMGSLMLTGKFEINNVVDYSYEIFQGYPMPMRNYRMTVGVEY